MGLPKIQYTNVTEGNVSLVLAQKGVALLVLKDDTNATGLYEIYSFVEVNKADWTVDNYQLIEFVYNPSIFNPSKLWIVRIPTTGGFSDAVNIIENQNLTFNYGCFPDATDTENAQIVDYITGERENWTELQFWKWIVNWKDQVINKEYIINFTTENIVLKDGAVSTGHFMPKILGLVCGCPYTQSLIIDAVYFNEVVSFTKKADENAAIDAGELILVKRRGKVRFGDDVTTFTTFTPSKNEAFASRSVVDRIDFINESEVLTFEKRWRGAVTTSYDNKIAIAASFTSLLVDAEREGLLEPNFNNRCEVNLAKHEAIAIAQGIDPSTLSPAQLRNINTGDKIYLINIIRVPGIAKDLYFVTFMTTISD